MDDIAEASMDVVVSTSKLLLKATAAAGDGDIDSGEKKELQGLVVKAKADVKTLAIKFEGARKKFGKAISQELLSESFFVFVLSAYSRKVEEYAVVLCTDPPKGVGCSTAFINGIKATFTPA